MRYVIFILSSFHVSLSYAFFKYSNLYFFSDEAKKVFPVGDLSSQGGDESASIWMGALPFSLLFFLFLCRVRRKINRVDLGFMLLFLLWQTLLLMFIEVASISLSLMQENGWVLGLWLLNFLFLWGSFFMIVRKKLHSKN